MKIEVKGREKCPYCGSGRLYRHGQSKPREVLYTWSVNFFGNSKKKSPLSRESLCILGLSLTRIKPFLDILLNFSSDTSPEGKLKNRENNGV